MTVPNIENLALTYQSAFAAPAVVFGTGTSASIVAEMTAFPQSGFTIECWVCTSQGTAGAVLFSYDDAGTNPPDRVWIQSPASLQIGYGASPLAATGLSVNDGQWHHLAVTFAPASLTAVAVGVTIDGVLSWYAQTALTRPSGSWPQADADLRLCAGVGSEPGFTGQLSEFRLWNAVLTQSQIVSGMEVRVAPGAANSVAIWPLTAAPPGATVTGGTFQTGTPPLLFRTGASLAASWTSLGAGYTYALSVVSSDNAYYPPVTALSTASYSIDSFAVNTRYTVSVNGVQGTDTGAVSTAGTTTLDLWQPTLSTSLPSVNLFQASWTGIDQAVEYAVALTTGSQTTTSTQTPTTLNLSSQAFGTQAWTYSVAALSNGAQGPPTAVPAMPAAPTLTLSYGQDSTSSGTLTASVQGQATLPHLLALDSGGSPVTAQLLAPGSSGYSRSAAPNNQSFSATARAVPNGAIGPLSATASVTALSILAPVITQITPNGTANTIAVSWTAASGTPAGASYVAVLQTSAGVPVGEPQEVSATTCTFHDASIVDGAAFQVRVRAVSNNSYGLWCAWQPVSVDGLGPVQNVAAQSDQSGDITVNWTGLSQAGVSYVVRLSGGSVEYSTPPQTDTSAVLSQATTEVSCGTTYDVTVTPQTSSPAVIGTTSAPVSVKACQVSQNSNNQSGTVSDPINIATGAYTYINADLTVPGIMPLIFTTYYSGDRSTPAENPLIPVSPLGNRWSHVYMTQIVVNGAGTEAFVVWGRQQIDSYLVPQSVTGSYASNGAVAGSQLFRNADLTYTLTLADATRYAFSSSGALTTIFDRYGNATNLVYQGGLLSTVTDAGTGNKLTFAYSSGLLQTVTDQSARVVAYTVTGGNLVKVVDPAANTRTFFYTGASLMQSAVDGNGNTAFYNTYTGTQVTKQQDARALASHQSYGTILSYTNETQGGVAVVVASGTDRAGNAISYTSLQANGATISSQIALSSGQIQAVERSYDGFNNLLAETVYAGASSGYSSGMGNTTTYAYDGNGNCITQTTPLGGSIIFAISRSFDSAGNKLSEAFYEGSAASFTQGAGNSWTYVYNADNSLHTATDPFGQVTRLTYVSGAIAGLVWTATDGIGNTITFAYQSGQLRSATNALGEVTTYGYDSAGRQQQISVADAKGTTQRTIKRGFNGNNQVLTESVWYAGQTEAQAFVTTYGYDGNGNCNAVTLPTNVQTGYGYNPNNYLSQIAYAPVSGIKRYVNYGYDDNDFIQSKTLTSSAATPLTITSAYVCDAIGQLTKFTDPNANVYTYSNVMRVAGSAPYALAATATWPPLASDPNTYSEVLLSDPIGRPTAVTARNGQILTLAYATKPGTGGTIQYVVTTTFPPPGSSGPSTAIVEVFDALGRRVSVTDQAGHVTTYAYGTGAGPNSSKTATMTVTDPNRNTRQYSYDCNGLLVGETAGSGTTARSFAYTNDAIGRLTQVVETQGSASTTTTYIYGYDAASNSLTVSIGRPGFTTGSTVQYYNGAGQLVKQVDPYGRTTSGTYLPWGALGTYTDGRGRTFTYVADDAGRLKQTDVSAGTSVAYTLDNNGNRRQTVAGSRTVQCSYDAWNRLSSRTGVEGATIGYSYWPTDQVKVLTYSDGKTVTYGIDNLQRLSTVTDWHTPARVTTYGYAPDNKLSTISFANGAVATYGFDDGGRLTGIAHTSAGLVVAQWDAQYDATDRLQQVTAIEPLPPVLAAATNAFTYTTGNQFQTVNGNAAAYDADGEYLGESASAPVLVYDVYNRVTSASLPDYPAATYTYDPDGLRVTSVVGGKTANAVFDINLFQAPTVERGDPLRALVLAVEAETTMGAANALPVYAGGGPVAIEQATDRMLELRDAQQAIQMRFVHGLGIVAQEDAAGNYRVYHADPVGNTWAMTDANGAISDARIFGPFGENFGGFGATATPFRFAGQFGVADDGSGLLYMRARSYMPAQYRFLQPDYLLGNPARPQSLNPYGYVRGNPAQACDPLGLDGLSSGAIAGIVVGSIFGTAALLGGGLTALAAFGGFFSAGADIGFFAAVGEGAGVLTDAAAAAGRGAANLARGGINATRNALSRAGTRFSEWRNGGKLKYEPVPMEEFASPTQSSGSPGSYSSAGLRQRSAFSDPESLMELGGAEGIADDISSVGVGASG
jgi:RHS repeat-associated protein